MASVAGDGTAKKGGYRPELTPPPLDSPSSWVTERVLCEASRRSEGSRRGVPALRPRGEPDRRTNASESSRELIGPSGSSRMRTSRRFPYPSTAPCDQHDRHLLPASRGPQPRHATAHGRAPLPALLQTVSP